MEIVKIDTFPTELGGRSDGSKHAPIIAAVREMKVGEIIRIGPFATAKEAENARTAANMCMRRISDGNITIHTRVRDINGEKMRSGYAAYVFIKKIQVEARLAAIRSEIARY